MTISYLIIVNLNYNLCSFIDTSDNYEINNRNEIVIKR